MNNNQINSNYAKIEVAPLSLPIPIKFSSLTKIAGLVLWGASNVALGISIAKKGRFSPLTASLAGFSALTLFMFYKMIAIPKQTAKYGELEAALNQLQNHCNSSAIKFSKINSDLIGLQEKQNSTTNQANTFIENINKRIKKIEDSLNLQKNHSGNESSKIDPVESRVSNEIVISNKSQIFNDENNEDVEEMSTNKILILPSFKVNQNQALSSFSSLPIKPSGLVFQPEDKENYLHETLIQEARDKTITLSKLNTNYYLQTYYQKISTHLKAYHQELTTLLEVCASSMKSGTYSCMAPANSYNISISPGDANKDYQLVLSHLKKLEALQASYFAQQIPSSPVLDPWFSTLNSQITTAIAGLQDLQQQVVGDALNSVDLKRPISLALNQLFLANQLLSILPDHKTQYALIEQIKNNLQSLINQCNSLLPTSPLISSKIMLESSDVQKEFHDEQAKCEKKIHDFLALIQKKTVANENRLNQRVSVEAIPEGKILDHWKQFRGKSICLNHFSYDQACNKKMEREYTAFQEQIRPWRDLKLKLDKLFLSPTFFTPPSNPVSKPNLELKAD